jgi:carnosine N-methyltransferase
MRASGGVGSRDKFRAQCWLCALTEQVAGIVTPVDATDVVEQFELPVTLMMSFDLVLGSLFPLALLLVGYRLRDQFFAWPELSNLLFPGSAPPSAPSTIYSLERAFHAYTQYLKLSYNDVQRMRSSYGSLGRAHKNLGYKIGYSHKLERLWEATSLNATLTEEIADLATKEHPELKQPSRIHATTADLARVRESLKHFVRDWSSQGSEERKRIFDPILNVLSQIDPIERPLKRVLVPGSGLGRLAWEISEIGTVYSIQIPGHV